MKASRKLLGSTLIIVASLLGAVSEARGGEAISLAFVSTLTGPKLQGKGTYSYSAKTRKVDKVEWVIKETFTNKEISRTLAAIAPADHTEWSGISKDVIGGTQYTVYAELTTTDKDGGDAQVYKSNAMNYTP